MDLSIVVINHNTPEVTKKTLISIRETIPLSEYEIILVDNSSDETRKIDPALAEHCLFIENRGFANACNAGAAVASGNLLLFLNSDVLLSEGAVDGCVALMQGDPSIGICGIRTVLPDGTLDAGCKRGFPTPWASFCYFAHLDRLFPKSKWFGRYHMTYLDDVHTHDVECVSGAFLMIGRDLFASLAGFDEIFFMYGEDVDLCYRTAAAGKRVVYFAGATVTHCKGGSTSRNNSDRLIIAEHDAMRLFYEKHYAKKYPALNSLIRSAISVKERMRLAKSKKERHD